MRKDIDIPEVKDVFMAVVHEQNKEFNTMDWNAYIINNKTAPIDTVLIVTKGFDEKDTTSTMRHSLKELPAKSFAKVEFMQDELLKLNNEFSVSFFADGKMLHKKFLFRKNSINEKASQDIPVLNKRGVLVK